jgi:hypothetical protein
MHFHMSILNPRRGERKAANILKPATATSINSLAEGF